MNESIKSALIKAIKDFITPNEIFSPEFLRNAASDYVYEHDEEIREHFREQIDTSDLFDNLIDEIDFYDCW